MRLRWILLTVFAACPALGCGGPQPYPVSGQVVYADGQPASDLAGSDVIFTSDTSSSSGALDGQGRYTLTTRKEGDGALPGSYKVVIVPPPPIGADDPKMKLPRRSIPSKYTKPTTTDLSATVEAKTNDITLTITVAKKTLR
jgi:hypothetical protein